MRTPRTSRSDEPGVPSPDDAGALVVGLTGGIGAGKTTVAERLAEHGAEIVDADVIARDVVRPGRPALAEIRERFGPEVLEEDGSLDRGALARVVFGDPAARGDLEAITHPRIASAIATRLRGLAGEAAREGAVRIVVVDHPLLVETGRAARYPVVVTVEAPRARRRERLAAGRGMDPEDVEARMASQASDVERRSAATHVIDNGADLEHLHAQVDRLWEELSRTAAERVA